MPVIGKLSSLMTRLKILIIPIIVFAFSLMASVSLADDPAAMLWQKIINARSWVEHSKFDFECNQIGERVGNKTRRVEASMTGTVFRRSSYLRINTHVQVKGIPGSTDKVVVSTPEQRLIWLVGDDIEVDRATSTFAERRSYEYVNYPLSWQLEGTVYLDAISPIFDLTEVAKRGLVTRQADEKIGDLHCNVLVAKGDGWFLTVWAVPSRGYNLARYHLRTSADPKTERPEGDTYVYQIKHRQLSTGTWISDGAQYYCHQKPSNDPKDEYWVTASFLRSNIDLSPDFSGAKAFEPPVIPDGTKVVLLEDDKEGKPHFSTFPHVWKSGKPVPAFDPDTVERLRKRVEDAKQNR